MLLYAREKDDNQQRHAKMTQIQYSRQDFKACHYNLGQSHRSNMVKMNLEKTLEKWDTLEKKKLHRN